MGWNKVIVSGSRAELRDLTASAVSPFNLPNITSNGSTIALVIDEATGNIYKASGPFGSSTLTLTQNYVYVGNASNQATGVPLTGDATISGSGALTLSGSAISNKTELSTVAGTEYVLVLDGTDLKKTLASNIGSRTGSFTGSFTGSIRQPLPQANIFVGNGSGIAAPVAVSGDITIDSTGVTTFNPNYVNNLTSYAGATPPTNGTHLEFFVDSGSGAEHRKFNYNQLTASLSASFNSANLFGNALNSGQIYVGNSSNVRTAVTPSGDVTISNTGVTTVGIHSQTPYAGGTIPAGVDQIQFLITSGSSSPDSNKRKYTWGQLTASISASFNSANLFGNSLPSANIFVGNASGVRTAVAMSGVTLISNTGVTSFNGRVVDESNLNVDIINQFGAWATTPPLAHTTLFAVSDGSNRKLTYSQLTSSLSASFAAQGLLNPGVGTFVSGPTPATSTTNAIPRWTNTNARDIKNSGVIIDDSNNVTGINDLTVNNNLYVNGTLTTINTDNLHVEDRFILLNSGSNVASPHTDAGFILQTTTTNGIMFGYDASVNDGSSLGRFGIKTNALNTDNGFTSDPDAFIATVEVGVSPPTEPLLGGTVGKGAMYVDNGGNIWIWS